MLFDASSGTTCPLLSLCKDCNAPVSSIPVAAIDINFCPGIVTVAVCMLSAFTTDAYVFQNAKQTTHAYAKTFSCHISEVQTVHTAQQS